MPGFFFGGGGGVEHFNVRNFTCTEPSVILHHQYMLVFRSNRYITSNQHVTMVTYMYLSLAKLQISGSIITIISLYISFGFLHHLIWLNNVIKCPGILNHTHILHHSGQNKYMCVPFNPTLPRKMVHA